MNKIIIPNVNTNETEAELISWDVKDGDLIKIGDIIASLHTTKADVDIESEFEGTVTLEFSNTTPLPAKIYANEGVAQFLFLKGNEEPDISYADRKGKYMGQSGVTLPKV